MKAISLFFYCLLASALFAMTGCASTKSLDSAPLEKKKDLPLPLSK